MSEFLFMRIKILRKHTSVCHIVTIIVTYEVKKKNNNKEISCNAFEMKKNIRSIPSTRNVIQAEMEKS